MATSTIEGAQDGNSHVVQWLEGATLEDLLYPPTIEQAQQLDNPQLPVRLGLVYLHASWNTTTPQQQHGIWHKLAENLLSGLYGTLFGASILVDGENDDDTMDLLLDDNGRQSQSNSGNRMPLPPSSLPALAWIVQTESSTPCQLHYIQTVSASHLLQVDTAQQTIFARAQESLLAMEISHDWPVRIESTVSALRLFVAGDKSSAGKSSVCMGLLGSFLQTGYAPEQLAYIKPATQSESTQTVEVYCRQLGITCVPIGPVVYYRGFTRAFLAGQTATTAGLLGTISRAVDRVARNKSIVLIDGVGFPAVGSICGTDNAAVAIASSYPVLEESNTNGTAKTTTEETSESIARNPAGVVLVGGSGVGAAVDAFNLNATFFRHRNVPVLGAIFNKLSYTGYYSLENCRTEVTSYFDTVNASGENDYRPFGFVPVMPSLAGPEAIHHVNDFVHLFSSHVNVPGLIQAARKVHTGGLDNDKMDIDARPAKRLKLVPLQGSAKPTAAQQEQIALRQRKIRDEIEGMAISQGAAPSA